MVMSKRCHSCGNGLDYAKCGLLKAVLVIIRCFFLRKSSRKASDHLAHLQHSLSLPAALFLNHVPNTSRWMC
ncbi:hypothetical protein V6N12_025452 [Hibiscus sabdariffa]|uniref:Uncharacterized protein n=1 Tax=Hibiscus sabdariffa TaxID=183260 RepID=A0ABR2CIJ4_9ROSI